MKIAIWIVQILLAAWIITGSVYMMGHSSDLASPWAYRAIPQIGWMIIGVLQILLAVGMLVPQKKVLSRIAPLSAIGSALFALAGAVLYVSYRGFPGILWAILPAAVAGYIAYKRS